MASYNIKHIEYLRQKANLTYEQAVALLDRNDGDITKALIELERCGALKNDAQGAAPYAASNAGAANFEAEGNSEASKGKTFWDNLVDLFIKSLRLKLVIEKSGETVARLPVIYLIVAVCMAPHLAILSVVLMFLMGCRVHITRANNPDGDKKIRDYARGAEQTVRNTVSNATGANRHAPYNAPATDEKKKDDDFDSFTVE